MPFAECLFVFLAREVRGGGRDQGHRAIRDLLHLAGVADEDLVDGLVRVDRAVRAELRGCEARVEGAGVVVLPAGHAEARRLGRFPPFRHAAPSDRARRSFIRDKPAEFFR